MLISPNNTKRQFVVYTGLYQDHKANTNGESTLGPVYVFLSINRSVVLNGLIGPGWRVELM